MLRRALCATHRDCRGKPLRVAGLIQVWECVCVCGKGKRPTHDITHSCWRVYICHNIMCVCVWYYYDVTDPSSIACWILIRVAQRLSVSYLK